MKKILNLLVISLLISTNTFADEKLEDKLHNSVRNGELELVKKIIEKDKSIIDAVNQSKATPLIVAATLNHIDICEYLIDKQADINAANAFGNTALHYAALNGQLNLAKKMIANGAKLKVYNRNNRSPIFYAAHNGNVELVKYLNENGLGFEPDRNNNTVLHIACNGGNIGMVKYLIEKKEQDFNLKNIEGYSVLHFAAVGQNSIEVVKYLIEEKGMDPKLSSENGQTVLHYSAFGKNAEVMKYLLENAYDVNEQFENGQTVLQLACRVGDLALVEYIIDKGVDVNIADNGGNTALDNAAYEGQVKVVELLMDKGALIAPNMCKESACSESSTAMHNAAWKSPSVMEYFIQKGVDINILDEEKRTALHTAMRGDSLRIISQLCDAKININQQDKFGTTALSRGVNFENVEGVKLLLKYNPDINVADISGYTALHYAAIKGNKELIEILLKKGADINSKDNENRSVLDVANYYGNKVAAETLLANGAESYNKQKNLFNKDLALGESAIWYLDHSGYAIKTKNNLLIFDYWEREPITENGNINNGYINPEEIKDLNVTVFASHTHSDHFSTVIFDWSDKIENINYVLGFDYNTDVNYSFIPAHETKEIDGVKITPVTSNDSGQGFYVEVDGVNIFHPGDHTNISRDMCPKYTGDIKFLAEKYKHTDIAFFPVTGCRFPDKVALNMGTDFALEELKPNLALPMHGSNGYTYKEIVEGFNKKHNIEAFNYPVNRGDRFFYTNSRLSLIE